MDRVFTNFRSMCYSLALMASIFPNYSMAAIYDIAIDTSVFSGTAAVFAFDFIDGNAVSSNTIELSEIVTDGMLGALTLTGAVSGNGMTDPLVFADDVFFSSASLEVILGNFISFRMTVSGNGPFISSPDAFSIFLLGTNFISLVDTDDPTGSDALLAIEISSTQPVAQAFSSISGVTTTVTPVPLPGAVVLLATGLLSLGILRKRSVIASTATS